MSFRSFGDSGIESALDRMLCGSWHDSSMLRLRAVEAMFAEGQLHANIEDDCLVGSKHEHQKQTYQNVVDTTKSTIEGQRDAYPDAVCTKEP